LGIAPEGRGSGVTHAQSRDPEHVAIDDPGHSVQRDQSPQFSANIVELAIRLAALGSLLYFSLVLIRPFASIVVWSIVVTVALYPVYEWLALRLKGGRRSAAALLTLVNLLVVVGPATWLALDLIQSAQIIASQIDPSAIAIPRPPQSIKAWPLIGDQIYQFWDLASTNMKAAWGQVGAQLRPLGVTLLRTAAGAGTGILKLLAAIVLAGFLFAPAPKLAAAVKKFSHRLSSSRGEEFANLAAATIRAVARGVIGIAVVQALLVAVGLTIAGVPWASLITSAVLIFGIIQIGPGLILIPVIVWSWFAMDTMSALLFTAYMLPVNFLDNVLRPIAVSRGLKTPMLVTFVGVLGGTLAYGITGLFLGPIVLAVTWELLVAWTSEPNPSAL
jgi:predicted PurR-regulated permease PerM